MHDPNASLDTLAVHAGQEPDEATGAVSPPIYQTSTYRQDGVGRPRAGYEYARTRNPTRERLERAVATLEGGTNAIAYSSGSATTAALAELVLPGEEIVACNDVYGGTFRYLDKVAGPRGVVTRWTDLSAEPAAALASALSAKTRLIWVETPTNPLLRLVDIAAVARSVTTAIGARGERPIVVVDNTFASPAGQSPLALGADIVFHSATKYLGGHSDTIGGIAVTSRDDLAERLRFLQNAAGAIPGPFDCFLVLRGLRTLAVRMERHNSNAQAVARFLASREDVASVTYPGLATTRHAHPQAELAARQMKLFSGMISFVPKAGGKHGRSARDRAIAICEATQIFALAESLGGVESLIEVPAVMTHASVAGSALAVNEALVRLSVGIEGVEDLIADLTRALDGA